MDNEQLVIRIRAGIDVAENMLQLWEQNKGYVCKIVNAYRQYAEEDDLYQEGYLGLSEAVTHYSEEEGIPFIIYAGYWIKQRIIRYIKKNGTVRIPEFMHTRIRDYNKVVSKWQQAYGRKPTNGEICRYLDISMETLENTKKAAGMIKIASLDVPVGEEKDSNLCDLLPGSGNEEEEVLDRIQREQLCNVLWPMVDSLPGQQSETLRARYREGRTLTDIAGERGTTLEAIRQQEQKGLRELRKPGKIRQLLPFMEDRIYSKALHGNGVEAFHRTWTSSTERAAIWETEYMADLESLKSGI